MKVARTGELILERGAPLEADHQRDLAVRLGAPNVLDGGGERERLRLLGLAVGVVESAHEPLQRAVAGRYP